MGEANALGSISGIAHLLRRQAVLDLDVSYRIKEFNGISEDQSRTLTALDRRCQSISRAIALLIEEGEISEAQTLLRSLIEAHCRFIYILHGAQETGMRLGEYHGVLYRLQLLADNNKVKELRRRMIEIGLPMSFVENLVSGFSDQEIAEAEAMKKKKVHVPIEEKWKIHRLVAEVFGPLGLAPEIMHQYALSCNMAHANSASLQLFSDTSTIGGEYPANELRKIAAHYVFLVAFLLRFRHDAIRRFLPITIQVPLFSSEMNIYSVVVPLLGRSFREKAEAYFSANP